MTGVMLQEQIVKWLERKREQMLNAARTANIPPSITISRRVITNISETGYTSHEETVEATPLVNLPLAIKLGEMVRAADEIKESPASALYETYGDRCKVWQPFTAQNFEVDPPRWIENTLLNQVASDYLTHLSSLETGDQQLAEKLAKDLISLIESEAVYFVTALPFAGIRLAEDAIGVENVRLRRLTPAELSQIADLSADRYLTLHGRRGLLPPFPRNAMERLVLEVRTPCKKRDQPQSELQPQKLVLALELLGFEIYGEGSATTWTEPGPSLWRGGQGFPVGSRGTTKECTRDELRRAWEIARRIPDGAINSPSNREGVALHRFFLGGAEDNPADKLIDYVIAIEGFLLPPAKEGEYRFKFGYYGAWYLAADADQRTKLFKEFQDIYDTRSRIVHGNTPEPEVNIMEKAMKARDLSARLLVKALEEGWPSHETLKNIALGLIL